MAKTKSSSRPNSRRRRSRRDSQEKVLWGLGGAVLLIVVLLWARSLLSPRSPGNGPREMEWLSGITGSSYDAGETAYVYPNPAGLAPGRKWLPALGDKEAPVVVIEFSDVFCSHCRDYNLKSLPAILEDYVATGKVRYVDHYFGFTSSLEKGTLMSLMCAAEQGRYFELKHALFQSVATSSYDVDRAARIAGIDAEQFQTCMRAERYIEALQEMIFVDNSGVSSTPTFYVNGTMIAGNDPEGIRQLIETALSQG